MSLVYSRFELIGIFRFQYFYFILFSYLSVFVREFPAIFLFSIRKTEMFLLDFFARFSLKNIWVCTYLNYTELRWEQERAVELSMCLSDGRHFDATTMNQLRAFIFGICHEIAHTRIDRDVNKPTKM